MFSACAATAMSACSTRSRPPATRSPWSRRGTSRPPGHMADAYFRVKHAPAATLTSCGPGSANMVMALANAYLDSSAFLAITANVPTQQFNRAPFQELYRQKEADFPAVCRPVVKRGFQPTRVEQLPLTLRLAYDTMLGGPPRAGAGRRAVQPVPGGGRARGRSQHAQPHRPPLAAPRPRTSPRRSTCWRRPSARRCSSATA